MMMVRVVVMVVVVVMMMLLLLLGVRVVMRVGGETVTAATLASHWRTAAVANRSVASLWQVVGVWPATGWGCGPGSGGVG